MDKLKKNWLIIAMIPAFLIGIFIAQLSFDKFAEKFSPVMILDKDVPSEINPMGYEPVELTGKNPEDGTVEMVNCKLPVIYEQYVHYPKNWEHSLLNPNNPSAQIFKYILITVAVILGILLAIRVFTKFRKVKYEPEES